MTLATVPRYAGGRDTEIGDHAVVVGGSMAGLFAARVLSDRFGTVTVIDRDALPDEVEPRDGVPQDCQPHVLLEAGRATIEDLFPGFGEDLLSAGGLLVDGASDFRYFDEGDFVADGPTQQLMYFASRPLLESVVRRRVAALDGVRLRSCCQFVDYLVDDAATTVEGVVVRRTDSGTEEVRADLVVDATGRTSRTPNWLADHGYTPPYLDEVHIDLAYSSTVVERPPADRRVLYVPVSPPRTRGGAAFPIEGDRWLVNVHGMHGDHPPTDPDGFAEFAASLPTPELRDLLDAGSLGTADVEYYPIPSNRRYRYEDLERFPAGLLVVGDAIASFNPIYAQGMSVAALEALVLHHTLGSADQEELAPRFFERAGEVVDVAWTMAVGADFGFSETTGSRPRGAGLFRRYLSRVTRKAHTDGELRHALYQTIVMERPPTALLRPRVVWRAFRPIG
ncbi:FAD-dependent oxidoreductase [Haloarchaeobius sp. HRN-SO-5]|uniref:FAD-dependent oxidoreductase n=1 Tax=Haloarchaeobius sp. HRN-SO-5 TaxID=3446118 RepID=UPI003EC122E0